MNGARTFLMRKGYLLTALAAAALLAVSPGTAEAQVTIVGPANNTVSEGDTATYTVTVTGVVPTGQSTSSLTVALTDPSGNGAAEGTATAGDAPDLSTNLGGLTVTVPLPDTSAADATAQPVSATRTISIQTTHDVDAENERFPLEFTLTAGTLDTDATGGTDVTVQGTAPPALIIDDDETQMYTLKLGANQMPTEGGDETTRETFTVDLKAVPEHVQGTLPLAVHLDAPNDYSWAFDGTTRANGFQVTVGASPGANTQVLTITTPISDGNRETDSITLTGYAGPAGRTSEIVSESFDVADANTLPAVTVVAVDAMGDALDPQPESIMEGGDSIKLMATVVDKDGEPMNAAENLAVSLVTTGTADALDYRLGSALTIAMDNMSSAAVDLEAVVDEDVGMEMLAFDASVSGTDAMIGPGSRTSEGVFSVYIEDATVPSITPKATDADYNNIKAAIAAGAGEDGLNPGETVTIMTADLFELADDYTASYGVSVEGDSVSASASGDAVTINAMMAGESKVTVTGTARMSSSLMPDQTVSNVASLTFPVEVVDMPLMITLEMPDNVMDGNIVEGMSYEIGVMANRMVTEAEDSVEVMIMRDRAQSDADDSDFSVGSATIMAGYDSATAELMVTEDMEPDSGTNDNMGEQLVLYGMAGDMETNSLTFTIWDAAVPALPLIAQLLLALFLALGGARLYRRRQG